MEFKRRVILCIGHRGAAGHAPENTLLSIRKAIELGADWIEIDVQWVGNELLVIHDERVDRTTNGRGKLQKLDIANLRSLDAGQGVTIPFLSEVFETVQNHVGLNIELKGRGTAGPVYRLIRDLDNPNILISSFHLDELKQFRRFDESIRIAPLFVRPPFRIVRKAGELKAWSVNVHHRFVTPSFVQRIHDSGMKVWAYTANTEEEISRLITTGVDGIISDYPDRVVRMREKIQ